MLYYPINLDIRGRKCLVVGGGEVAERKVGVLHACEASVRVVSPRSTERLRELARQGRIELIARGFAAEDLSGAVLVIAATDDAAVNEQIYRLAEEAGILVNVVDSPDMCNFIVPATVTRGNLQISVSTGGKSPALAKRIRRELESQYGYEYEEFVEILGEMRDKVKAKYTNQKDREAAFNRLVESDVLQLLTAGETERARERALECI
ncbi:MAG: bifunctional precorrin-2 dehydrogenase/sirohydrochlorin ferrochelatase [Armatimonadota bacterium]|nr:bifunctional precorrin-2 dehydrogenase/sirohydrochlorin ferrochelatase [Armatimonadota bacterium]